MLGFVVMLRKSPAQNSCPNGNGFLLFFVWGEVVLVFVVEGIVDLLVVLVFYEGFEAVSVHAVNE